VSGLVEGPLPNFVIKVGTAASNLFGASIPCCCTWATETDMVPGLCFSFLAEHGY
jgi:hypothetical protein